MTRPRFLWGKIASSLFYFKTTVGAVRIKDLCKVQSHKVQNDFRTELFVTKFEFCLCSKVRNTTGYRLKVRQVSSINLANFEICHFEPRQQ